MRCVRASIAPVPAQDSMGMRLLMICCGDIALVPPTIYYSRVGLELGKLVFEAQKMSPP
jgi:F-type H+-transporting ATPase subunit g